MIGDLINAVLGRKDSVSNRQVADLGKRESFSRYLPYITYNAENGVHLLTDNTLAYMWEIVPIVYQGPKQTSALEGVLKQPFPEDTILQYMLFPDSNVDHILDHYVNNKSRLDDVGQRAVEGTRDFFKKGAKGLSNIRGVPVRNYRGFICLKSDADITDFISTVEEMLASAGLAPRRLDDEDLIALIDRILNNGEGTRKPDTRRSEVEVYTRDRPLREHMISRESIIDFSGQYPLIGNRGAVCLTPKEIPDSINPLKTNNLFGGVMGVEDDAQQHNYDYFYSLNIIFSKPSDELSTKATLTMGQTAAGSFSHQVDVRVKEFDRFRSDQAKNINYVKVIPTLWVFGDNPKQLEKNIGRAKMVWGRSDAGGFTLERESILNQALFIVSLPGGLYNVKGNVETIDRHFYMSVGAVSRFLPVQGDYAGNGLPVTLFVGRKGQLVGVDLFAPQSTNHNFLVCAESGGGKSFLLNTLLSDYYYCGDKIRIVDIGRSYEKLCKTNNGKFIDLRIDSDDQCINPMDFIVKRKPNGEVDEKDLIGNLKAASLTFSEMVYSKSKQLMPEHESQLIKDATIWTYNQGKQLEGSDAIYEYLVNYKQLTEGSADFLEMNVETAQRMAYCIKDFTSRGPYGKFFVGKSTIRIADDDFVVIELDDIKGDPELFSVVVIQMMNEITQDLYLSDRKNRRFILFEEAPSILKDNGNTDLTRLAEMIDEGYRRARKYGGAFGLVMQSILDTEMMGKAGKVALSNAAYKFMLSSRSNQYTKASDMKIIGYEGFALDLLNSLRNNKPKYAEVFIEAPQGNGVARLIVDPFRYLINTTEAHEVAVFNQALLDGKTPLEATLAIKEAM